MVGFVPHPTTRYARVGTSYVKAAVWDSCKVLHSVRLGDRGRAAFGDQEAAAAVYFVKIR